MILKFKGQTAYNQFHKAQRCTGHSNGPVKATVIKPMDSLFSSSNLKQLEKKSSSSKHYNMKMIKNCNYQAEISNLKYAD